MQRRVGVRFLIGGTDEVLLPEKGVDENNAAKVHKILNSVGNRRKFPIFIDRVRIKKAIPTHIAHVRWNRNINPEDQHVFTKYWPIPPGFLIPYACSKQAPYISRF